MYYKLENGFLVNSDSIRITPDGRPVSNLTSWLIGKTQEERVAAGWYNLVETPKPTGDYMASYSVTGDHITLSWVVFTPPIIPIQLDRDKLRNWLLSVGKADWLTEKMTEERFCTFWYSEMCYVKGSYMAELIKQELNITQEQLEAIVAACKI